MSDTPEDLSIGKKDIAGVQLCIGQTVAFNPPRYKGLVRGKIVYFTKKMVRIEYKTFSGSTDATVVWPTDCVVIPVKSNTGK